MVALTLSFNEDFGLADILPLELSKQGQFVDRLALTETPTISLGGSTYSRTPSDSLTLSDLAVVDLSKLNQFIESLLLSESISISLNGSVGDSELTFDDPLTLTDIGSFDLSIEDQFVDSLTLGESILVRLNPTDDFLFPTDTTSLEELTTLRLVKQDQFVDELQLQDSCSLAFNSGINLYINLNENLVLSQNPTVFIVNSNLQRSHSDTLLLGESALIAIHHDMRFAETLHLAVTSLRLVSAGGQSLVMGFDEPLTLSDDFSRIASHTLELADSFELLEEQGFVIPLSFNEIIEFSSDHVSGINVTTPSFYQRLNRYIRAAFSAYVTAPIIFTNTQGPQVRPYMTLDVEIDEDRQTLVTAGGHEARGTVRLHLYIPELRGDAIASQTLDEIHTSFKRLTYQEVRFQPPRISKQSALEYIILVPFSYRV